MNSPEEKAKELIDKMKGSCCMCPHDAESSAYRAVDEILSLDVWDWPHNAEYGKLFWEDVKSALEAM